MAPETSSTTAKRHGVSLASVEDAEIALATALTVQGKNDVDETAEAPASVVEQNHPKSRPKSRKRRPSLLVCIPAPRRARLKRIR